jgi:hypothetical protein
MDESRAPFRDPTGEFLGRRLTASSDLGLRQRLFRDTTRVVRRRRRWKQAGRAAALVACYLAGVCTSWLGRTESVPDPQVTRSEIESPHSYPSPPDAAIALARISLPLDDDPDVPAVVFERVAVAASPERRSHLFRRAGDRYLDGADEIAAIRCYRLALDSASERDLVISPDDNWLLIALKKARQEGKNYVHTSS